MRTVRSLFATIATIANNIRTSSREFAEEAAKLARAQKVEVVVRVKTTDPTEPEVTATSPTIKPQTRNVQRVEPEVGRLYATSYSNWKRRCFYVSGVTQTEFGRTVCITNLCDEEETILDWPSCSPEPLAIWQHGMISSARGRMTYMP